jgi:hypothetical protein
MWAILEYLTILLRILSLSDKIYPLESIPRPLSLGGDFYEGTWKKNFQDGRGRYVWKNRNEYVGEWKLE